MRSTILLAAILAVAPSARAQDANGRFVMSPTPDGYLKMDTRTGSVSQCTRQGGDYQCRLTPDERTALQDEIDRLSRENAELRSRVAGGPAPALPTPPPGEAKPSGPSDADIDRALTVMERFLRRFKDILRDEPTQNRL